MIKIYKSRLVCKKKKQFVVDTTKVPNVWKVQEIHHYMVQIRVFCFWIIIKTFIDIKDPEFAKNEAEEFLDKYNEKI